MDKEQQVLAYLLNTLMNVHTEADLKQSQARERKLIIVVALLALLLVLSSITKPLSNVIADIQSHDWSRLMGGLLSLLPYLLPFLGLPAFVYTIREHESLPGKVLALRRRLNDETLVPPLAEQPLPFEAGDIPLGLKCLRPLRRVKGISFFFIGMGIFFLFMDGLLGIIIVALLPLIQGQGFVTPNLWAVLILSSILILLAIFTALVLVVAIRILWAATVVVDEWGLRWKWPNLIGGRSIALAWHEASGFYEIAGVRKGKPVKSYVFDGPTGTFFWTLRENSTPKERYASTYLTRLIVTRTGLPLRDLTMAVEPLLHPPSEPKGMKGELVSNRVKRVAKTLL